MSKNRGPLAPTTVTRPRNRRALRCETCGEHGFHRDFEFLDETGWECNGCGSNNYYPAAA